jgi:NAD(P)-dependent dehydrogenase (short-subunit alcohol dehydrogenase family)
MTELRFDGRVVAITGAAQGMGREYALLLAARGARILVNDIKGAQETVDLVRAAGGEAIENCADITDAAQTDALVEDAISRWGRIDAVINNAAIYGPTLPDPATTERIIGVHLLATINMIRSAMPHFRAQRYGRILNVGSGSMFGLPGNGIYAAGKAGVFGFTRVLARDLEAEPDLDIRANLILPAAFPAKAFRVTDAKLQNAIDHAFTQANIAPMAALLVHEACPAQGEAIHVGGGRHARILLATTDGWQAPDDKPTPEDILSHWDEVIANANPAEPVGSMHDLLIRSGLPPYNTMELVEWTRTGRKPEPKAAPPVN